ncbi:hypothetical protein ACVWW1_000271 [Bradyrhizobium sp. JR3.5]
MTRQTPIDAAAAPNLMQIGNLDKLPFESLVRREWLKW